MFLYYLAQFLIFNFQLKLTQKCVLLKTWKKFGKPGNNFEKTGGNPVFIKIQIVFRFVKNLRTNLFLDFE